MAGAQSGQAQYELVAMASGGDATGSQLGSETFDLTAPPQTMTVKSLSPACE
jgi:hypothetical protein